MTSFRHSRERGSDGLGDFLRDHHGLCTIIYFSVTLCPVRDILFSNATKAPMSPIHSHPEIKTIALPENVGFSAANNVAFERVKTKYVALLNNDAVAHPLWLKSLAGALETNAEAGFAASKILYYGNPGTVDRAGSNRVS